ncbi:MAG: TetR/AcrR family transcriptional regulator, tetracycline repressor protein [Pseudonocardiales bacterium]|nr:TetR/AcrR family transcriptional regulator, tetracycline repressor protein [Pseudonocardiales bacterium]
MDGTRRRGRPARISREQIVRAARDAGADVRMADVARALDVAPTALYHHVRDRDELLELVAAQVLEETAFDDWAPAPDASWADWVRAYALAFRAAMLENAGLLRYVRLTTATTAGRLEQIDALVGALQAAGFTAADVMHTVQHVNLLVRGEAWERALIRSAGDEPQLVEFDRAVAERAADLPNLVPLADPTARPDADSHFGFALDCLIAGLAGRLEPRAGVSSTRRRRP